MCKGGLRNSAKGLKNDAENTEQETDEATELMLFYICVNIKTHFLLFRAIILFEFQLHSCFHSVNFI